MKTTKVSDAALLCDMTGDGWDAETARMEITRYRRHGLAALTETPRRAIARAIRRARGAA